MASPFRFPLFDPLYGNVEFEPAIADLASQPLVQRLRHIRLSNVDSSGLPGIANVSRYEHALGSSEVGSMRDGLAGQEADAGVVSALRQVVAHFESIFLPAEFACRPCGKVVRKGQEDLCAERLEKGPPGIAG